MGKNPSPKKISEKPSVSEIESKKDKLRKAIEDNEDELPDFCESRVIGMMPESTRIEIT
jgi:hypothetical protein